MPTLQSVDHIAAILIDHAYGPGLTLPDLRRLYPAKEVRRATLLETLAHLERLGLVRWRNGLVWWIGPIPSGARPLGIAARRINRYETMTPAQRVQAWLRLQRLTKAMRANDR